MTRWALVRRGLTHHWRGHLAVTLGVAVAGAVLIGSLLVGDSVRASLQALVGERLGQVEVAVVAPGRGVRAALAGEVSEDLGPEAVVAPVLRRSAVLGDPGGGTRVVGVELFGVTPEYWRALGLQVPASVSHTLRPNERLAEVLGLRAGSEVVVRVGEGSSASLDAPMALASSTIPAGALTVGQTAEGLAGDFTLDVHGTAPMTALVPLAWLSELAGDEEGEAPRANALLVRGASDKAVRAALKRTWKIGDMGLTVSRAGSGVALRSDAILLPQAVVDAEREIGRPDTEEVLTWFADTIRAGDREVPYSFVTSVWSRARWQTGDDPVLEPLLDNRIAVNQWLADQLQVSSGDTVEIVYPTFGPRRTRGQSRVSFRVGRVLPMEGLAADPTLSIAFPGFESARSCREWEPGVPIDLDRIRDADEAYWSQYRGAPKAFLSPAVAKTMWRNPYGPLTSLRAETSRATHWTKNLPGSVSPDDLGLRAMPVAAMALEAASPTTDFGGLFVGLGGLLVIAALILVVLLLRLGLAQRAGEAEALRQVGLRAGQIRTLQLGEGALAVFAGAALALAGGLWVARWTLDALSGVWEGAIGGLTLVFDATTTSLASGAGATLLIGLWALVWARRSSVERPPGARAQLPVVVSVLALGGAAILLAGAGDHPAATYFGAGGCLWVAGLAALTAALRAGPPRAVGSLTAMAWANLARRPRAVVAATAVLAAGTFVVVGVGVSRHDAKTMIGTGGFALLGESTLPVSHGLDTAEGLAACGLAPEDLMGASVVPLRVRDGDDASCLNLAQAPRPTLYGVDSQALAERRAFGADAVWSRMTPYSDGRGSEEDCGDVEADVAEAPGFEDWDPEPPNVVPAVGDEATLTWRLKLGVGDELEDVDEQGRPYVLRIVGVLPNSILQGGLIVDTSALSARFPTTSGDRLFLIDAPQGRAAEVGAVLSDALGDTGFVTTPTSEVLGRYLRVENTYLAIFLALGGLGLLLGAPGVGILLFRQVLTRRRELAVLAAMGWRRRRIRRLVALEHGAIVVLGVGIGGLSAALAVVPALGTSAGRAPAEAAAVLVTSVALVGLISVALATRVALRGRLVDALGDGG